MYALLSKDCIWCVWFLTRPVRVAVLCCAYMLPVGLCLCVSLQDNTESEWEPEYVGAGLGLVPEDPMNWQYSLRHR